MTKKRDRLEIIKDILETMKKNKAKPTHVMYKANLSYQMLTEYTQELLDKKLIEQLEDKKGKKVYKLTDKGFNFLKDFSIIRGFVDSYGLE